MWINYLSKIRVDPKKIYEYVADSPIMREKWKEDYYNIIYEIYPLLRYVEYVDEDDMEKIYKEVNYELNNKNKLL